MDLNALRLSESDGCVRLEVRAKPRAKKSRIDGEREGALVVRVAAPPVDGAANAAIVDALAGALGLPKRQVTLARGDTGRQKLFEIRGLTADEVRRRLVEAASEEGP